MKWKVRSVYEIDEIKKTLSNLLKCFKYQITHLCSVTRSDRFKMLWKVQKTTNALLNTINIYCSLKLFLKPLQLYYPLLWKNIRNCIICHKIRFKETHLKSQLRIALQYC